MNDEPLAESLRRVRNRHLDNPWYSTHVRVDTEKLERGDKLRITVEKVGTANRDTEKPETDEEEEDKSSYKQLLRTTVVRLWWRLWMLKYGR